MIEKNESGLYEIEIDKKRYEFEKWGAEMSLATLIKISKIAGKPLGLFLGSMMSGESDNVLDKKISPDLLSDACEALVSNMDETTTIALIKKLSSEKILCDGRKINFDMHYQDQLGHLFKVVKTALEVQYGNFFEELLGIVKIQAPIKKKSAITNHR
jgi:hypothetical protein